MCITIIIVIINTEGTLTMQHIGQLQATLLNFGRTTGAQAKQFIPIERIKRLLFNASVIALVVVLVMAFLNSRLSTSLVDLVLVGAIPHTTHSIPPTAMLIFYALVTWFLAMYIIIPPKSLTPYDAKHPGSSSTLID